MRINRMFVALAATALLMPAVPATAQLGARPAEEWIQTLDGPQRVAGMKIPELVAALKLQPGQTVADIGAGSGLLEPPLAHAVGPKGRVYAVEIDEGFFPMIKKRASEANVTNVETVLGKFSDPVLPVKNFDVALFHDVLHLVEARGAYIKTLVGYLAPSGRVIIVDYEGGRGPHREQPELEVTRDQLAGWMKDAGLKQVEDIKLFEDKYFLVFAK